MYGRGSSDDKGPVLGWLNAIEAYQSTGTEIPVNLKVGILYIIIITCIDINNNRYLLND